MIALLMLISLAAVPDGGDAPAGNALVRALAACGGERDDARRLACFDAAAARLVAAERDRDVVVVDRAEVKRTRRSLFGLNLGPNDVFAGRDKPADRVDRLDTTLVAARELGNGRWSLVLAEGGHWQTTEAWTLTATLKPGAPVLIHPGTLGSYVARVGSARAVRVQRVN